MAGIVATALLVPTVAFASTNGADTNEGANTTEQQESVWKSEAKSIFEQVKSGDLSREEAKEQLQAIKEAYGVEGQAKQQGVKDLDEDTKQKLQEIKAQVDAGELTREEAKAEIEELGLEAGHFTKGKHVREKVYESLDEETIAQLEEIKAQVEAGELTKEEAKTQLQTLGINPPERNGKRAIKKGFQQLDEETREQLTEIRESVKDGELTKEEAKEQVESLNLPESIR